MIYLLDFHDHGIPLRWLAWSAEEATASLQQLHRMGIDFVTCIPAPDDVPLAELLEPNKK